MEHITGSDYMQAKSVRKDFEIKNLAEYLKSVTLLWADIFKNFRRICLKIYNLNPEKIYLRFWIIMASSFKKH